MRSPGSEPFACSTAADSISRSRRRAGEARKQIKQALIENSVNTFEAIAREWFEKHSPNWEASYSVKLLARRR